MTAQVLSITATAIPVGANPLVVDMPATVAENDLLAMFVSGFGSGTISTPTDWAARGNVNPNPRMGCFVIKPDATKAAALAGSTVSVTVGGTPNSTAQVYRISAASWSQDLAGVLNGTPANGASNSPDPPSVDSGGDSADNLIIAATGFVDDDATVSSYPTNYTDGTYTACGAGANANAAIATARRALTGTGDDPGAFTLSETETWIAMSLLIPPAANNIAALLAAMDSGGPA